MALTITTTITVADDEAYTEREAAILAAIANHPAGKGGFPGNGNTHTAEQAAAQVAEQAAAPAAAKAPATRKKAPVAPTSASSTTPAVLDTTLDEPEATPEPEAAPEEDLVAAPAQEYTMDDAVTRATELVNASRAAEVKAALAVAGAKRVSELKGAAIATFMNELAA